MSEHLQRTSLLKGVLTLLTAWAGCQWESSFGAQVPEWIWHDNQDEILDLLAYLEADGQKEAICFNKPSP